MPEPGTSADTQLQGLQWRQEQPHLPQLEQL